MGLNKNLKFEITIIFLQHINVKVILLKTSEKSNWRVFCSLDIVFFFTILLYLCIVLGLFLGHLI